MAFRLDWRGVMLQQQINSAMQAGLEETAAACIAPAKQRTPVRTGILQGSIKVDDDGAQRKDGGWSVLWGSFDVNYAYFVETGTGRTHARAMLRSAADQEYPSLHERIQRRMLW